VARWGLKNGFLETKPKLPLPLGLILMQHKLDFYMAL
jgi:predicted solute-binding protein